MRLNKIYKVGSFKTCQTATLGPFFLFDYLEIMHLGHTCCIAIYTVEFGHGDYDFLL